MTARITHRSLHPRGRKIALTGNRVDEAVEMYRLGASRRQVAIRYGVSDMAVRTALRNVGEPMRTRSEATAETNKRNRQAAKRIRSVFDLAA